MWKFTELVYFLASLYYRQDDVIDIVIKSGHKDYLGFMPIANRATVFWTNILIYFEQKKTVKDLLQAVLNDGHAENEYLQAMFVNENTAFKSPYSMEPVIPIQPVAKKELEKLTQGKSTLLPISFLEMGIVKSKAIGRVVTKKSLGSGFLVKNKYFITNNHVIDSKDTAKTARVELNYQNSITGALLPFEKFKLDPDEFATSIENDWTIVKLRDFTAKKVTEYGYLNLGKVEMDNGDYVNIIQHPGGETKQIALYHNLIVGQDKKRVQYLTDTMPGSSGSPVFNTQWEVVALHHAGGDIKVVGTNDKLLINEGININLVLKEIKAKGFDI